jgi:hypothetical protein
MKLPSEHASQTRRSWHHGLRCPRMCNADGSRTASRGCDARRGQGPVANDCLGEIRQAVGTTGWGDCVGTARRSPATVAPAGIRESGVISPPASRHACRGKGNRPSRSTRRCRRLLLRDGQAWTHLSLTMAHPPENPTRGLDKRTSGSCRRRSSPASGRTYPARGTWPRPRRTAAVRRAGARSRNAVGMGAARGQSSARHRCGQLYVAPPRRPRLRQSR